MKSKKQPNQIKEQGQTYEDYAQLSDDGTRFELVNGELEAMSPSPHPLHQLVCQELFSTLKQTCQKEYVAFVAPIDLILSEKEVRQPDLVMLHQSRIDIVTNRGIEGAPDLVVEILSPTSIKRDRIGKFETYASFSIPEYWIIDPIHQSLEQYLLNKNNYKLVDVYQDGQCVYSHQLTCVSFSVNDIFSNIPHLPNA
ncbi:Uma2 family endonuclease [Aquibacillus salsiterrae]|uniref:Uma2 family endonuclease n=1 Tax=Aquibacillus salsiterrae TaxID=2950439 RepID=A0A9X3WFL7_9BACI|nr:Uma2 family endonuclease [Aquibacillus salsiterrae]MDC3416131.1 Uma2 family endonuclease [Aquibacillus salsiterrae]